MAGEAFDWIGSDDGFTVSNVRHARAPRNDADSFFWSAEVQKDDGPIETVVAEVGGSPSVRLPIIADGDVEAWIEEQIRDLAREVNYNIEALRLISPILLRVPELA